MYDDVMTRDEEGALAVRTVGSSGDNYVNKEDVYTRDDEGKLCIRVTGSGGGDSHNLGYFDTLQDLQTAYPTGEAGDWAIVAESDTVYIWDETQQAWVDTDRKGQVTSVNNQTGDVTIGINDILPTQTDKSGYVLGTDGFVAGWIKLEQIQRSALPQASEEEVDKIYQFVGTTDATYTNGYFYKCVSDGGNPATYSWTRVDVQPTPSGLPDQTGQSGKFLTTDGTDASWSDKPLVNNSTNTNALAIGNNTASGSHTTTVGAFAWNSLATYGTSVGYNSSVSGQGSVAIGANAHASGAHSIQISTDGDTQIYNNDANTFKVANDNGNFEIMSADGTIPTDRLTKVNSTITLTAAGWSSNTQTVNVTSMTATGVVMVSPDPTDQADYTSAGIICSAQAAGTLTFTCSTTPSADLSVNVVML